MKKFKAIFSVVSLALIIFLSQLLLAQTDPGIRDTLFVTGCYRGPCNPGTEIAITVWAYHDEGLGGISIPLKYKNPQIDVTLDSVRFHPDMNVANLKDSIRDNPAGTIIFLFVSFSVIPAGTDTFATLYFTTGPTWDPAIYNPIDTFRIGGSGGQGLSFTDTAASPTDIVPFFYDGCCIDPVENYPSNGIQYSCICMAVKDDNRFPSTLRPITFSLSQNFPNPFNAVTVIAFALHASRAARAPPRCARDRAAGSRGRNRNRPYLAVS